MPAPRLDDEVLAVRGRELAYHEKLYSGFAQTHFARPAVAELRRHLVDRIVRAAELNGNSQVLSLGCGIGDTELILARQVGGVLGIDISAAGVRQAQSDAARAGISNAAFRQAAMEDISGSYDAVIAIFFLHHLSGDELSSLPRRVLELLKPGGVFYSLDPSSRRLSGAVGRVLVPWLMRKYQTADERELEPEAIARSFELSGFAVQPDVYDFGSTSLAGLFPRWRSGYRLARRLDDVLLRASAIRHVGSNFEIVARRG